MFNEVWKNGTTEVCKDGVLVAICQSGFQEIGIIIKRMILLQLVYFLHIFDKYYMRDLFPC